MFLSSCALDHFHLSIERVKDEIRQFEYIEACVEDFGQCLYKYGIVNLYNGL